MTSPMPPAWISRINSFSISDRAQTALLAVFGVCTTTYYGHIVAAPEAISVIAGLSGITAAVPLGLLWHCLISDRAKIRPPEMMEHIFDMFMPFMLGTILISSVAAILPAY